MPHIHDKIDFTVETFVVYKNKVLLRKHDKYGIWLSVGGHIELDEDPNEAAIREVKEEVGLDVELCKDLLPFEEDTDNYKELIPPQYMDRNRISTTHEHVTMIYFATSRTDVLKLSENEKTEDCRWFTREELDDKRYGIKKNIIFYAKAALGELES